MISILFYLILSLFTYLSFVTGLSRISTFAGDGRTSFNVENIRATSASLYGPSGAYRDSFGNMFVVETSGMRIRKIDAASSLVTTIVTTMGGILYDPQQIYISNSDVIYFASEDRIGMVVSETTVSGFAGLGDGVSGNTADNGKATSTAIYDTIGVFGDAAGNIYISQSVKIRKVDTLNIVTTYAGNQTPAASAGDGIAATSAALIKPLQLFMSGANELYYVDGGTSQSLNCKIRKITNSVVTTVAGISTSGCISNNGDNTRATSAPLCNPTGVSVDPSGNVFIANGNFIRMVEFSTEIITTIAGSGYASPLGDGGPPTSASLYPKYLYTDPSGFLYIGDWGNNGRIRLLDDPPPTQMPTIKPSQPTSQPSMQPSGQPRGRPTGQPSRQPSRQPTGQPTRKPSTQPTRCPTSHPSVAPSRQPSSQPSVRPSRIPSIQPTSQPSTQPSSLPSLWPSSQPTRQPSTQPNNIPSSQPSTIPSSQPSQHPTVRPSIRPSMQPSSQPSSQPISRPSVIPSNQPSSQPTNKPSGQPSLQPQSNPSSQPTHQPTILPSAQPSSQPSKQPITMPTSQPSVIPSMHPTLQPVSGPSVNPTLSPSTQPSSNPSRQPSSSPTCQPSTNPSANPSTIPTTNPSTIPTGQPLAVPSNQPTCSPSSQPSITPSIIPSQQPSMHPSHQPSVQPSSSPSIQSLTTPSCQPSSAPSGQPSLQPFVTPSGQPSTHPSVNPSRYPSSQPISSPSLSPDTGGHPQQQSFDPVSSPTNSPSEIGMSQTPTRQPSITPSVAPSLSEPVYVNYADGNFQNFRIVLPFLFTNYVSGNDLANVSVSVPTTGTGNVVFGNSTLRLDISPAISYDYSGRSVSNAGDVNGDGFDDLIIGIPYASRCYVLFGKDNGFHMFKEVFTIFGADPSDLTGWSVSSTGDVNNDTYADLIIGAPNGGTAKEGIVYIIYGQNSSQDIDLAQLSSRQGVAIYGANVQDTLGISVSNAGDLNGDGFDDIVIGALRMNEHFSGTAYIIFGTNVLPHVLYLNALSTTQGVSIAGPAWSWLGYSVGAAGDVNGDGIDDVLVSSFPRKVFVEVPITYIIFGQKSHPLPSTVVNLNVLQGIIIERGGILVTALGDVDEDGFDDVLLVDSVDLTLGGGIIVTLPHIPRPTVRPTVLPTMTPTTTAPSFLPTLTPTSPTAVPSMAPTAPTYSPSMTPTQPTVQPSATPTAPTVLPSVCSSVAPTKCPTHTSSFTPSAITSTTPTRLPTVVKTSRPTVVVTKSPTNYPIVRPSIVPTESPTASGNITYTTIIITSGGVYQHRESNIHYIINSTSNVVITDSGNGVVTLFTVLPNRDTTLDIMRFNLTTDTIDVSAFVTLRSFEDINIHVNAHRQLRTTAATNFTVLVDLGGGGNQFIVIHNMTAEERLESRHFIYASSLSPQQSDKESDVAFSLPLLAGASVLVFFTCFILYKSYQVHALHRRSQRLLDKVTLFDEASKTNKTFITFNPEESDKSINTDTDNSSNNSNSSYESPNTSDMAESVEYASYYSDSGKGHSSGKSVPESNIYSDMSFVSGDHIGNVNHFMVVSRDESQSSLRRMEQQQFSSDISKESECGVDSGEDNNRLKYGGKFEDCQHYYDHEIGLRDEYQYTAV